ncbi:hypothetical protein C489_11730 [Natrinema versiforme JCM 10478]|uniref:Uncharacterized protein n=1 Tax=Natrinema versiforme JCM 10478 TaxID=1227496 RepID=L9Y090_9EURY|nr:hypothetical protein C489_11730 [Natrinema versiforme JCM 10478]
MRSDGLFSNTALVPNVRTDHDKVERQFTAERRIYSVNHRFTGPARDNDRQLSCVMPTLAMMGRNDRLTAVSPGHDRWDTVAIRPS